MRKITIITMAAILVFAFASCDNGTTSGVGGASWDPVGTWKWVRLVGGDGIVGDQRIIIKSDKTFQYLQKSELLYAGNYEVNGELVFLKKTFSANSSMDEIMLRYDSTTNELVRQLSSGQTSYFVKQ